jgi:hypothetical protein
MQKFDPSEGELVRFAPVVQKCDFRFVRQNKGEVISGHTVRASTESSDLLHKE